MLDSPGLVHLRHAVPTAVPFASLHSMVLLPYSRTHPRDPHSFPTRRSSDLARRGGQCLGPLTVVAGDVRRPGSAGGIKRDRKSTRLNSSHANISYAVFCLKKKRLVFALRDARFPRPRALAARSPHRRTIRQLALDGTSSLLPHPPPRSTLFPYTTLFRSCSTRWPMPWTPYGRSGRCPSPRVSGRHQARSEEHTSELQSRQYLVCRLLLEKKKVGFRLAGC